MNTLFEKAFDMTGKLVLITGGGTGLGFAMARCFVAAGARVVITGRRGDVLREACAELGENAYPRVFDVTQTAQAKDFIRTLEAELGPVDVLVNNAGTDNSTWLTKLKQSEWDAVCNLNMKGPYPMMKYAIPHLTKTKGCIVNTASVAGVYGCPTGLPYPASKAALIAMTKSVAYSFADRGVRVNAVAPGVVNTDMVANMPQFAKDSVGDTIPMKRFAEPEDIANGILFLSSSAASYVTGVCLQIDGGYRPNNLPK